jgi:hypothetical protein
MLNDDGDASAGTGFARAVAARTRVEKMYFILPSRFKVYDSRSCNDALITVLGEYGRGFAMIDIRGAATTLVLNVDVFSRVRGLELQIANPSAHLGFSKVLNEWANDGSYGPFKERVSLEKIL